MVEGGGEAVDQVGQIELLLVRWQAAAEFPHLELKQVGRKGEAGEREVGQFQLEEPPLTGQGQ
ncbi:MAG: hypothetical protein OHK0047_43270 [Leptolyngbyaceae cyanobacterium]